MAMQQTISPVDGRVYVERPLGSARDIEQTLATAVKAQRSWQQLGVAGRGALLSRAVDAFVARQGVTWSGSLEKDLTVWYFPDCEVVHYLATTPGRSVRCVEFEAMGQTSLPAALAVIERYERATGFDAGTRCRQSLVDLLFPGALG